MAHFYERGLLAREVTGPDAAFWDVVFHQPVIQGHLQKTKTRTRGLRDIYEIGKCRAVQEELIFQIASERRTACLILTHPPYFPAKPCLVAFEALKAEDQTL